MKWLGVVVPSLLTFLLLLDFTDSQVYSRRRYVPYSSRNKNPFTLTRSHRPKSTSNLRYGGKFSSAKKSRLPNADALRAGKEGSYDHVEQSNAILPDKSRVKPTKPPTTTTTNPNKINIETRLAAVTESKTKVERANVGGTAILHCYFDESHVKIGQYKNSQIWWTKQPLRATDRPTVLGAGTQIRLPDYRLKLIHFSDESYSILIIKDVLMSDAGEYKCSLPTVSGTQTAFASLQVYDPSLESIAASPEENIGEVGGSVDLFCKPEKDELNVWWTAKRVTGETIEIVSGKREVEGRELRLINLRQSDAGIYTCHIQVLVGSPIMKEFTLKVKEKPWAIAAFNGGFNIDTFLSKFNKDPEYGDEVNLRCDSGGIPTPAITWWIGSEQLTDGSKYNIKSHEPTHTPNAIIGSLTITNFSPEDEGRYHCRAVNEMGSRQREFTIKGYYNRAIESARVVPLEEDDEDFGGGLVSSANLAFGHKEDSVEGSGDEGPSLERLI